METVKVRIRYQFAPVPRELAQNPNVSARTLGVVTYLCSRGEDWEPRVYDIKKRFGFGDHVWRQVSKEMRALNILAARKTKEGTSLIFDPLGIEGMQLVIHNPPVDFRTVQKPTRGKSTDIYRSDHTLDRSIKNHIDHGNDIEKRGDQRPRKLSMKEREAQLNCDQQYTLQKLCKLKDIFLSVALSIIEQNSIGDINNVLEMALKDGVKNPGGYVVKQLYRKQSTA